MERKLIITSFLGYQGVMVQSFNQEGRLESQIDLTPDEARYLESEYENCIQTIWAARKAAAEKEAME